MSARQRLLVGCLFVLAVIHLLPVVGVSGAAALREGYGLGPLEPAELLLLRHRAVLFGLLAAGLLYAIRQPAARVPLLLATLLADSSFLLLAWPWPALTAPLQGVVKADVLAVLLAVIALWALRGHPRSSA